MESKKNYKLVVIGDGAVGKTCLLMTFAKDHFPKEYVPTVFDNYLKSVKFKSGVYNYNLWDTAGQEDYDNIRPLSYAGTDIFLLCYSVDSRTSFENIKTKWAPELMELNYEEVPRFLVATKMDLRSDNRLLRKYEEDGEKMVSTEEGENLRKEIGAFGFMESSAMQFKNIQDIFMYIIEHLVEKKAVAPKQVKKSGGGGLGLFKSSSGSEEVQSDVKTFTN